MHRSRRLMVVGAAVLVVAACAPVGGIPPSTTEAASTTTTATVAQPQRRGVVVGLGTVGSPRTLNPLLDGPDTAVLDLLAPAMFATGWRPDPATQEPVPHVLADLPTVANGGIVDRGDGTIDVEVAVAPDAVWGDGVPMSGRDLEFTYQLAVDPSNAVRSDVRARYDLIVPGSMRADGRTVSFRMQASHEVSRLFDIVVPEHQVAGSDFTADWNDTTWVSGGPFAVESWMPGQYLELVANDSYWVTDPAGGTLPRLDRVVVRFFETGATVDPRLLDRFAVEDLDVAVIPDAQANLEAYGEIGPAEIQSASVPSLGWEALVFQFGPRNRNADSLNRHVEYRRAVAHAIDRNRLAASRGTDGITSVLAPYLPARSDDPWAQYEYDPGVSAGLLEELGDRLGRDLLRSDRPRLVLTTSSGSPATVATAGEVVVMLEEAGIAAELQLESAALFFGATLDSGTWDLGAFRYEAGAGTAAAVAFLRLFDPDGVPFVGSNFARWGTVDSTVADGATGRYADTIDELAAAVDPDDTGALLRRAETLLAGQVVLIPLVRHGTVGMAWWGDQVVGPAPSPAGGPFWNLEEWADPLE